MIKGLFMLTRLKLLQSKYNLSNEFMSKAIRSEIERQARLDINGAINNCSIALLDSLIGEFNVVNTPAIVDNTPAVIGCHSQPIDPHYTESEIKKNTGVDTFISTHKNKAKRRG